MLQDVGRIHHDIFGPIRNIVSQLVNVNLNYHAKLTKLSGDVQNVLTSYVIRNEKIWLADPRFTTLRGDALEVELRKLMGIKVEANKPMDNLDVTECASQIKIRTRNVSIEIPSIEPDISKIMKRKRQEPVETECFEYVQINAENQILKIPVLQADQVRGLGIQGLPCIYWLDGDIPMNSVSFYLRTTATQNRPLIAPLLLSEGPFQDDIIEEFLERDNAAVMSPGKIKMAYSKHFETENGNFTISSIEWKTLNAKKQKFEELKGKHYVEYVTYMIETLNIGALFLCGKFIDWDLIRKLSLKTPVDIYVCTNSAESVRLFSSKVEHRFSWRIETIQ